MLGLEAPDPSNFQTVFAPANEGELEALTAIRTVVIKLRPAALAAIGNKIQLRVYAPLTGLLTMSTCSVGPAAASGHAWNFSAATQITWDGGVAAKVVDPAFGDIHASDEIDFDFDGSKALCLAFDMPVGARMPFARDLGTDVVAFYKDGVSEAASIAKGTGYTPLVGFSYNIAELAAALA